ncbi:MAG TPA: hypothetical protein VKA15_09195 [Isosphaeraceae bacterium]|nr:hypothetical protein [Isosphaeraceae bacterium]
MTSVSKKLGMTAEALRSWIRQAHVDDGRRSGLTIDERASSKALEHENREQLDDLEEPLAITA